MILKYMQKRDWATAALCALFITFQVYLDLKIPEYMSNITNAISRSEPSSVIVGYGMEMVLCALISFAVALIASSLAVLTATSLCRHIRELIFSNVSSFTPEDVGRFSIDSLITRCSNDVSQVQNFVAQALQIIVKAPIITIWALVKISGAEWQWTVATAVGLIVMVAVISVVICMTWPRYQRIPRITDKINHYALEHLTGLRVVRAYNAERFQEEKFADASIEMMNNSIYLWKRSSIIPAMSSGTSNFLTLIIYWTGITLIASTSDSATRLVLFSDMIVFSSYAIQVVGTFIQLSFFIQFSSRAIASSKRVQEVVSYKPVIVDGTFDGNGDEPGTIEFDHVNFTYPGTDSEALHDISFKVDKGQTLAIIGATGSGKSTMVNLMLRSYLATSGKISVDGVAINDYLHSNLYEKISYVPQTNIVFTGTIEDNVNYGSTSSKRDINDVNRAIDVAQARDFVDDIPEKEKFHVSEGGRNLSGGQRQRVTIARAVCKGAEICIFDDPFSALDFATDKKLRSALKNECEGITKVLVTQRVGTVMEADLILVLDEGHIVGRGRHEELLESCPLYREIAVSQMVEGTI